MKFISNYYYLFILEVHNGNKEIKKLLDQIDKNVESIFGVQLK